MSKWIKKDEVIKLMRSGWRLSFGDGGIDRGHAWLEPPSAKDARRPSLHLSTFNAMQDGGVIRQRPRTKDQPFWRHEYELSEKTPASQDKETP